MGGVLVEYSIEETKKSLQETVFMLETTLKALDSEMAKRQKEVLEMELKYGLNPNKKEEIKVWVMKKLTSYAVAKSQFNLLILAHSYSRPADKVSKRSISIYSYYTLPPI